ncbi:hypothetical protein GCM10010174_31690 [Kutzneria viridogrisea]|uniref:Uncharacterized protein n=2 Tax=Kutzneria TaxID=43356 RepID=W5VYV2_9PSEU|nr:hypothetical protein [Kutzneria albida]AHH93486.1 hypothetical protein KALB_109 [Kutzneria albida DSM 43870]MBA8929128.1 hypothetical protein [Kutzneria viridogrisea]
MSGFIHWYENGWSADRAARTVARIESLGLSLSEDTDRNALLGRLSLTEITRLDVEFWLDADTALYGRFRRVGGDVVAQEFDLDGLSSVEQNQLVQGIAELFGEDADNTVGFVVDRSGCSEDVEWDEVVLGHPKIVTVRPDVLALPCTVIEDLHPELQKLNGRAMGALTVYDRTNVLAGA